jgi:hypothetical protein
MNFSEYINRMRVNYFINNAIPNAAVLHPLGIFRWIKISHDGRQVMTPMPLITEIYVKDMGKVTLLLSLATAFFRSH